MEKIGDTLKKLKTPDYTRKLLEDEYMQDGLIHCKACKTPRQCNFDWDGETKIFPQMCECQQKIHDAEEAAIKEADRKRHIETLRLRGIPNPAYREYRFAIDDGQTPKTTQACKNFVKKFAEFQEFGGGLILWGSVGTGKTFFAMCIANALVDRGYNIQCTTLATVIKQAQDFDNADNHFNCLMRKSLIVVDDLGTERGTSFANEQIYKFIDGCNTHNIPLIFTTNYPPSVLQAATEDTTDLTYARIYSRILEKCTPIPVLEVKRRANNEKANYDRAAELLGLK